MVPRVYVLVSMVHFQAWNLTYLIRGLQKFTYSSFQTGNVNGLAGLLADNSPGCIGCSNSGSGWPADRVLDRLFALALEVSGGGGGGVANCVAAYRPGPLCFDRDRIA